MIGATRPITRTIRRCTHCCRSTGPPNPPWHRILVIGQEPDTDERMGGHVGPYDLGGSATRSFWILSHKAVGRASGIRRVSPGHGDRVRQFAYRVLDASPASHAVGEMPCRGRAVTNDDLEQHARNLLSLPAALACPWSLSFQDESQTSRRFTKSSSPGPSDRLVPRSAMSRSSGMHEAQQRNGSCRHCFSPTCEKLSASVSASGPKQMG